jgi:small subunit ribosomal protein S1
VTGKTTRLFDRGAIVDVGDGIEGFIPISQLGVEEIKKPSEAFLPGEELHLKVTRVDVANHRLLLSIKAWLAEQDDVSLAEWMATRNRTRAEAAALEAAEEEKTREREERKAKKSGKDAPASAAEEGAEPLDDLDAGEVDNGGPDVAFEDLGADEPGESGGTAS